MYTKPSAPRSIGGVLDDAFRLFRAGFMKTWPIAILAQAIVSIPLIVMKIKFMGMATPQSIPKFDSAQLLAHLPAFIGLYLILVLGSIIFQNAMLAQYVAQAGNTAMSVGQSLAASLRFFLRALGILGIYVLGAMAIGIVVALAAAVLGGIAKSLLVICLVVLIIVLAIRLFLANAVLVAEDSGAINSIRGSWTLSRGNFWRITGILTVLFIVTIVILLVVGFVAGLIAVLIPKTGLDGVGASDLLSILLNSLFAPLVSACLLAIYFDLKLRRDGSDLAGRVDALAAG